MVDRKLFSWHFEPIVQPTERVLLKTDTGNVYGEVTWIEPYPWIEIDFGAIEAGKTTDEREMKELYVANNEFAQFRMRILTDNVILSRHMCPKAVVYYATEEAYPYIPPASTYNGVGSINRDQLTEFYQYKDVKRFMKLKNIGTSNVTESKVVFFGYIFQFKKLPRIEKPYTTIPCVARKAIRGEGQ